MITWLRRLILAAALAASAAPAFAQAPPPVPALPDTERRTSYSLNASTCSCAVNFSLFGDSTDYQDWLEVWVNGVLQPSTAYIITSPTGPLATIPRPITDAVLTFVNAQTGTIQIVGARRPRRLSQFSENRGVAARDLNLALTDIVAQNRETWDKLNDVTGRVPRFPPGETQPVFPPASQRANMGVCFDNSGNMVPCVSAGSSTFSAGNGISFTGTNPTTIANNIQAGNGISFTGTNPIVISRNATTSSYVLPSDFGAKCDGATDDSAALQAMLTASPGRPILITGKCWTSVTLNVPSNTTITGGGWNVSEIHIMNCSGPALALTNVSNIDINHIALSATQSCVTSATSTFGMISLQQNGSASAAGINYSFQFIKFYSFNGTYWNYINTTGSTFGLSNFTFNNNWILTTSADIPADDAGHHGGNFGLNFFTASGGNGRISNTSIKNNQIDGTALCFAITMFENHYKYQIANNIIDQVGQGSQAHCNNATGTTINSYAVLAAYDGNNDGNVAFASEVTNNDINQPYGSGIYLAAAASVDMLISGNLITQQTSQDDATLPRAAIAINSATDVLVVGNQCYSSFGCIAAVSQAGSGVVSIIGNHCTTGIGAGVGSVHCLRLSPGASSATTYNVTGNFLECDTSGNGAATIRIATASGFAFAKLYIKNNVLISGGNGILMGSQFVTTIAEISGNSFGGSPTGVQLTMSGTPAVALNGNIFSNSASAPLVAGLPSSSFNGSSTYVKDGTPATACTGGGSGSNAFYQNGAWKCF